MAEHWRRGGVNVNRKMRGLGIGNRTMNKWDAALAGFMAGVGFMLVVMIY